jgi:hypothetical protein
MPKSEQKFHQAMQEQVLQQLHIPLRFVRGFSQRSIACFYLGRWKLEIPSKFSVCKKTPVRKSSFVGEVAGFAKISALYLLVHGLCMQEGMDPHQSL